MIKNREIKVKVYFTKNNEPTCSLFLEKKIISANHPVNIQLVDTASVLHDIAKRRDKEMGVKRGSEHQFDLTAEILRKAGYSDTVIEAATYSGRVPEIDLDDTEQDKRISSIPIEHLIIAYVDSRVRNTNIVSLEKARDENKQKIPLDANFYDRWYRYYQKVEKQLFSLAEDAFTPSGFSEDNVFKMVQEQSHQTQNLESLSKK